MNCGICNGASRETPLRNVMGTPANLLECVDCGTRFYDRAVVPFEVFYNTPAAAKMAETNYSHGEITQSTDDTPERREYVRKAHLSFYSGFIDKLKFHAGTVQTLFEAGTDWGEFPGIACAKGIDASGCEVNRHAASIAREREGLKVEGEPFSGANVPLGLDAIVMLDVIEHTSTPVADLVKAYDHLRPGGVLLLKTFYEEWHAGMVLDLGPTAYSKPFPGHGYYDPLSHLWHFTVASLRGLIERIGFEVVDCSTSTTWGQVTIYATRPNRQRSFVHFPVGTKFIQPRWLASQGVDRPLEQNGPIAQAYREIMAGGSASESEFAKILRYSGASASTVDRKIGELRTHVRLPSPETPIKTRLTARGLYEVLDGHHRVARWEVEDKQTVPVEIAEVSPLWSEFTSWLATIYPGKPTFLYQGIEHPFFDAWHRDRSDERLEIVLRSVRGLPTGALLDIGSCTGRFCREFNRLGWISHGVDRDPVVVKVAEYLDMVMGTRCSFRVTDDPYTMLNVGLGYGAVVCLSVFHRALAKGEIGWVAALFKRCMEVSRLFIVDNASPTDASVLTGAFNEWAPERYHAWLRSIAPDGTSIEPIGASEDRTIYACRR